MYDAGYSSSSRLYERTASQLGMTPDKYRRGAIAAPIRYTCTDSPLGRMLIAATEKGICTIQFADSDDELEHGLRHEFPFAIRRRDDAALETGKTTCFARCMDTSCAPRCRSTSRPPPFSGACGRAAVHSLRRNPFLRPGCESHWPADRDSRSGPRLRYQSGSPSPSPVTAWSGRGRHGRLSLGCRTQGSRLLELERTARQIREPRPRLSRCFGRDRAGSFLIRPSPRAAGRLSTASSQNSEGGERVEQAFRPAYNSLARPGLQPLRYLSG